MKCKQPYPGFKRGSVSISYDGNHYPTGASTGVSKGVHTFPKGISLKVTIIAWMEFELTFYNVTVQHVSHDTTGTPPPGIYVAYQKRSSNQYPTHAVLNKSWKQHPTKWQLYSNLTDILQIIQERWARHAEHCRRNKDKLIIKCSSIDSCTLKH